MMPWPEFKLRQAAGALRQLWLADAILLAVGDEEHVAGPLAQLKAIAGA
jgi:hypothetical protein